MSELSSDESKWINELNAIQELQVLKSEEEKKRRAENDRLRQLEHNVWLKSQQQSQENVTLHSRHLKAANLTNLIIAITAIIQTVAIIKRNRS